MKFNNVTLGGRIASAITYSEGEKNTAAFTLAVSKGAYDNAFTDSFQIMLTGQAADFVHMSKKEGDFIIVNNGRMTVERTEENKYVTRIVSGEISGNCNHVTVIGRLTDAPKITENAEDPKRNYCGFTVAVNNGPKDEHGADFIQCKAFGKNADYVAKYGAKGSGILVQGYLNTSRYTDRDGEEKEAVRVVASNTAYAVQISPPSGKSSRKDGEDNSVDMTEAFAFEGELPF